MRLPPGSCPQPMMAGVADDHPTSWSARWDFWGKFCATCQGSQWAEPQGPHPGISSVSPPSSHQSLLTLPQNKPTCTQIFISEFAFGEKYLRQPILVQFSLWSNSNGGKPEVPKKSSVKDRSKETGQGHPASMWGMLWGARRVHWYQIITKAGALEAEIQYTVSMPPAPKCKCNY